MSRGFSCRLLSLRFKRIPIHQIVNTNRKCPPSDAILGGPECSSKRKDETINDRWFGRIAAGAYYLLKMRSLLMSSESTNYVKYRRIECVFFSPFYGSVFSIVLHAYTHIYELHSQAYTVRLSWQQAHQQDKNCFLWHAKWIYMRQLILYRLDWLKVIWISLSVARNTRQERHFRCESQRRHYFQI